MPRRKPMPGSADEVEAAYYDALSRADIDALMSLWADDDDIVCIHPNTPRLVGHTAIRAAWEEIMSAGQVGIRPRQLHVMSNMLTAVHSVVEELYPQPEEMLDVHVIATNVYMKTARGWKIVMHHASVAIGPAPAEPVTSTILH